jgi:hypothetical protein
MSQVTYPHLNLYPPEKSRHPVFLKHRVSEPHRLFSPRTLPIIRKLKRRRPIALLDQLHHRLQVILGLGSHPQDIALDRSLNLGQLIANRLRDFLGDVLLNAFFELDRLANSGTAGGLGGAWIEDFERDISLAGLGVNDRHHRVQGEGTRGVDIDLFGLELNFGFAVFQVVARFDFTLGLIDRVDQFLVVKLADDVK